jgi:hypothetical protein
MKKPSDTENDQPSNLNDTQHEANDVLPHPCKRCDPEPAACDELPGEGTTSNY